MTRSWIDGGPPFLSAANLNAMESDITSALGVPDVALASRINDPGSAASAALNATYAPASGSKNYAGSGAARLGNRWLFHGDSITAGGFTADQLYWGGGYVAQTVLQSQGSIIMSRNTGIAGNTTQAMVDRFDTDVAPYAANIDVVMLLAGTNDSLPLSFSAWVTSYKALVAKVRGIGKAVVIGTIPPNTGAAPRPANIIQQNAWIRRYAAQNAIPCIDFYKVLVDPATGSYKAGYNADATHPNQTGQVVMATELLRVIQPTLTPGALIIPQDNNDPQNLLTNGCFQTWTAALIPPTITTSTVATGGTLAAGTYFYKVTVLNYQGESLPSNEVSVTITAGQQPQLNIPTVSGQRVLNIYRSTTSNTEVILAPNVNPGTPTTWLDSGSLTPGTTPVPTVDYSTNPTSWGSNDAGPVQLVKLTDSAFQGYATRMLGTGTVRGQNQSISATGKFSVGDKLAFVAIMRSSGTTSPELQFQFTGGSTITYDVIGSGTTAWGPGIYYTEATVPTGATTLTVYFRQNTAVSGGSIDFGQIGVYNLTTLGALT